MKSNTRNSHYLAYPIQPREIAVKNNLGAMEYSVVKRMHRWRKVQGSLAGKGVEDLEKAIEEIEYLIACVKDGLITLPREIEDGTG